MHAWRAIACQRGKHPYNETNGWKLIAARLTIHLNGTMFDNGGPLFAVKIGPPGPIFCLPNLVQGTSFGKISANLRVKQ